MRICFRDIKDGNCGKLECDGRKKLLVFDSDGTFTDSPDHAYILPVSEMAWDDDPKNLPRGLDDGVIPNIMRTYANGSRINDINAVRPFKGKYTHIQFDSLYPIGLSDVSTC